MKLYLQLQIHYIKPQTLDEITVKLHLINQRRRPNTNINPYFLNHIPQEWGSLATHQETQILPSMMLKLNGYQK